MLTVSLLDQLNATKSGQDKKFAILIDPDDANLQHFEQIMKLAHDQSVDYILIGGSLVVKSRLDNCIDRIRSLTNIPIVLFPGHTLQVSTKADAILFLSLISGRNPEYLIGQHVAIAPQLKSSGLEVLPTGYMLIDGGKFTSAQYISHSLPIPGDKPEIAVATAMAGEMLGMKLIYLDAGSGAQNTVNEDMISEVANHIDLPIVVGGGLRSAEMVYSKAKAGADLVVVGNAIEKDPSLIMEMSHALNDAKISS